MPASLEHYLGDQNNRKHYEYALSGEHFSHQPAPHPEYYDDDNDVWRSTPLVNSCETGNDIYIVGYQPNEWRMYGLLRDNVENPQYYATDAIIAQYTFASKSKGFFGQLPKKLSMVNINNPETLKMIEISQGKLNMEQFLSKTVNGKLATRLARALGKKILTLNVVGEDSVEFNIE